MFGSGWETHILGMCYLMLFELSLKNAHLGHNLLFHWPASWSNDSCHCHFILKGVVTPIGATVISGCNWYKKKINSHCGCLTTKLHCKKGCKKLPEQAPTNTRLCVLSIMQLHAWAHWRSAYAQLLSPHYPLCRSRDKLSSTAFLYCKRRKAGEGLGTRLCLTCLTIAPH